MHNRHQINKANADCMVPKALAGKVFALAVQKRTPMKVHYEVFLQENFYIPAICILKLGLVKPKIKSPTCNDNAILNNGVIYCIIVKICTLNYHFLPLWRIKSYVSGLSKAGIYDILKTQC